MVKTINKKELKSAFNALPARERRVLVSRLTGKTLKQTAKTIKVKSAGHAFNIEKSAWDNLMEELNA